MNYINIEKIVKENKLESLLKDLQPIFENIDVRSQRLMAGTYTDGHKASQLLMKATGWHGYLSDIYNTLDTIKTDQETRLFNSIKMKEEKLGKKITAAVIDKAVSAEVMGLRRVRNIIGSYRDICDKMIFSCQSLLKSLNDSYKRTRD